MKACILMASPKPKGNTATLLKPFIDELRKKEVEIDYIFLYDKRIDSCYDCRTCQNILDEFGCPRKDDVDSIVNSILVSDCIVLATPIYSWYCTPPMKALLDRLVRGMNKYYGEKKGNLWQNKKCGIVTTCGYSIASGAGIFEQGVIKFCKHSQLDYIGMIGVRDKGDPEAFKTEEAVCEARNFANKIISSCKQ